MNCLHKSPVFSGLLHMNMSVKVTGLESTKERKAVYKTGTGTRERGHWGACVGTWDLGLESQVSTQLLLGGAGPSKLSQGALAAGRKRPPERPGELARRLMPDKCPGEWADFVILV